MLSLQVFFVYYKRENFLDKQKNYISLRYTGWVNRRTISEQKATEIFAKQSFRTFINNHQLFARSSPTSAYVSFCGITALNKVIKVIISVKFRLQFTAWLMVVKNVGDLLNAEETFLLKMHSFITLEHIKTTFIKPVLVQKC